MAQNKRFICPSLLIVLIFAQEIQFIHGRHLKLGKKNVFLKLQAQNKMLEKETRKINNAKHNNNLNGYVFPDVEVAANADLVSPPQAPSVAVGETLPPPPPRHVDAFRPTAPGHSPGVGHSFGQINNAKHNNNLHGYVFPVVEVAVKANLVSPPEAPSVAVGETLPPPPPRHVDDFRPTAPGHSPGVGHSLQN